MINQNSKVWFDYYHLTFGEPQTLDIFCFVNSCLTFAFWSVCPVSGYCVCWLSELRFGQSFKCQKLPKKLNLSKFDYQWPLSQSEDRKYYWELEVKVFPDAEEQQSSKYLVAGEGRHSNMHFCVISNALALTKHYSKMHFPVISNALSALHWQQKH